MFAVVLVPALLVSGAVGQLQYHVFTDEGGDILSALFLVWVFAVPFVPIPIALVEGLIGRLDAALAFAAGVAALIGVPWLVDRSIEGDESSTAGLVHLWDPVLMTAIVGAVVFAAWARRRRASRTQGTAPPRA